MRFLLTRPHLDSQKLAQKLQTAGHEYLIDPVMDIDFQAPGDVSTCSDQHQALLFTSANGVRAYCKYYAPRTKTVFAVGNATAEAAAEAGFTDIQVAGGNVDKLAELVKTALDPNNGPLLHIAGQHVAGDLKGLLQKAGFDVIKQVLYQAKASEKLSHETTNALKNQQIDIIPLYSPRTARLFMELIQQENLQKTLANITALCLSSAVKDVIICQTWGNTLTAQTPDEHALFSTIKIELAP